MYFDRAPVFWLTMRQFLDGRSIRVVVLLAAAPLLLGGIEILASGSDADATGFLGPIFNELNIPTLLPLIALILASTALSNEITDRTLPYLVLKPWHRLRLVVEKFAATVLTGTVIGVTFSVLTWFVLAAIGSDWNGELLSAVIIGNLLAVLGYAAAFSFLSLLIQRVLLAGLLYILIWESLLARFIPGIRLLSIRHYVQSVYTWVVDDASISIDQQTALSSSILVILAITVAGVMFSWWRLRRMDLD